MMRARIHHHRIDPADELSGHGSGVENGMLSRELSSTWRAEAERGGRGRPREKTCPIFRTVVLVLQHVSGAQHERARHRLVRDSRQSK